MNVEFTLNSASFLGRSGEKHKNISLTRIFDIFIILLIDSICKHGTL